MNPPDHPTPRTDAIAHRGYPEPSYILKMTDLARTLERELAAAKRELAVAENWVEHHSQHADDLIAENVRLRALSDQLSNNLSAVGAAYNDEKARAEKDEAECLEQARLLGMSGEREADLLGKLGRLESELAAIKGTP